MRSKHRAQVIPLFAALAVVCGLQHAVARQASEFASVGAAWIQCGGINGCPPGLICYDLPWQGHECPDGYHCLRLDQYYWWVLPPVHTAINVETVQAAVGAWADFRNRYPYNQIPVRGTIISFFVQQLSCLQQL